MRAGGEGDEKQELRFPQDTVETKRAANEQEVRMGGKVHMQVGVELLLLL